MKKNIFKGINICSILIVFIGTYTTTLADGEYKSFMSDGQNEIVTLMIPRDSGFYQYHMVSKNSKGKLSFYCIRIPWEEEEGSPMFYLMIRKIDGYGKTANDFKQNFLKDDYDTFISFQVLDENRIKAHKLIVVDSNINEIIYVTPFPSRVLYKFKSL